MQMRPICALALLGALSFIAMPACAQVTKQGDAYLFRRKLEKGMTIGYKVDVQFNMAGVPKAMQANVPSNAKMTMTYNMKVLEVKDGKAKVHVTGSMTDPLGKKGEQKLDQESEIDAISGGKAARGMDMLFYPDKPIRIGAKTSLATKGEGAQSPSVTFVGFKTVQGKQYAQLLINYVAKSGGLGGNVTITANALVSPEDGWPMQVTSRTVTNTTQEGANIKANILTTMERK